MELFESSLPLCPRHQHCSLWAWRFMKFCLCSVKDEISLTLGVISVISWAIAEIPQIITNYKEKSSEGLSIAFLMTWIVGDLFNVLGCFLEPATLPTQFYMAVLYTITTLILTAQSIYYGHIYHRLKSGRWYHKMKDVAKVFCVENLIQIQKDQIRMQIYLRIQVQMRT
ncbi:putative vacuolar amino acid transporter YPQ3 [Vitis vinifera]|uniref:Putative vacuolar amino acid transporter YPQ3 n=1 Tax=Vitis vinifera TaxID=29760 RepID=A0A438FNV8_VITVI|nr:putative vacuolar amino acid transporter YPQ3 [Vitis vinifera]